MRSAIFSSWPVQLIEIKSRMVLPGEEEVEQELEDPRQELVRRLLEYKQYRDAASMLEERSREWRERYPRMANDMSARPIEPHEQPIHEVELWDLVSAFGRVLKAKQATRGPENIRYDDTPIHVFMQRIDERLRQRRAGGVRGVLRRRGSQVDADRHVPGGAAIDAASARAGRRRRSCSTRSGWSRGASRCRRRWEWSAEYEHGAAAEASTAGKASGLEWQLAFAARWMRQGRHFPASPLAPLLPRSSRMINNLPVKTLKHGDLTIEGYSRAAVQTYWRFPELKLGFDLGAQPWSFMGTETWFVTHGHLDHIVALPVYVARRRMMKMTPPVIYMPAETIDPMQKILHQFTRLDRGRLAVRVEAGGAGRRDRALARAGRLGSATRHTVPSLGYIVWDRRRKLKPEYQSLSGDEIRDLRLAGTEVTEEIRRPRVAYLGDSAPAGLDDTPMMYEAEILICELTFVASDHRKEQIHKFGHMHLDDLVERRERFKNQLIIAAHLSTRYHPNAVRDMVTRAIPDMLGGRLHLWL